MGESGIPTGLMNPKPDTYLLNATKIFNKNMFDAINHS